MAVFVVVAFAILFFWWINSLDSPNSTSTTTTKHSKGHQIPRFNQANQLKEQEEKRLRELEDARRKAAAWEAEQKQIKARTEKLNRKIRIEEQKRQAARDEQRRQAELRALQERQAESRELQQRQVEIQSELELFENDTDYYYALEGVYGRNSYSFSFAAIRSFSRNTGVWEELNNGVAQLDTEEQLQQYTFSYGNMHKAKLLQAFESLVNNGELDLNGQTIEIIDYGCGQGIGTVVFFDFLKSYPQFNYSVRRVRLIEPSELALKRASLHVRYSLSSVNQPHTVHAINKELDEITVANLACDNGTVKFHIFSNILDVEHFDLYDLYEKIVDSTNGLNYFICVSPNIFTDGSHPRNQRLVRFREYFQNSHNTTLISRRISSIQSNNTNPWTRFEKVFKVHFDDVFDNITRPTAVAFEDEPDDLPF